MVSILCLSSDVEDAVGSQGSCTAGSAEHAGGGGLGCRDIELTAVSERMKGNGACMRS